MGATTDFRVYKEVRREVVKAKFREACEDARYENGHGGYTGTIAEMNGIAKFVDRDCASINEAENYIVEHHQKWDDAMAVSFKLDDGTRGWIVGGWCSE